MRVLITGGYGFIGSHVAEKFKQEGYQVSIIDNLSSGNPESIDFKHNFYKLDVEDKKCREIFKINRFDVVVHLAAQVNVAESLKNPFLDTKSNILGLVNMLRLSNRYGVKKFIFASSAAIYGDNENIPLRESVGGNPFSPYGMSKLVGELYCKKWKEIYGLNTIAFRFSNVYGPRQGKSGEGGVISIYLERLFKNQELIIYGDGNQTRDFIYVEDVADAIYRSVDIAFSGVLNLSSNTEKTINGIIDILKKLHPVKGATYKEARPGDIYMSCLDNTIVKAKLDWVPMHSLENGLEKTYKWYAEHVGEINTQIQKNLSWRDRVKASAWGHLLPYGENLVAFGIVAYLSYLAQTKFDSSLIDYKLLYIILMGVMYGTMQSTISAVLSSLLFVVSSLSLGRDIVSMLYDSNSLLQISFYILVGLVIGYTIDRKNSNILAGEVKLQNIEEKYAFLNEVYNETREVKEELQYQIITSDDSFGKIYRITTELDTVKPELIFISAISILEEVMKSKAIAIFYLSKNEQYMRLVAKSKNGAFNVPKSLKINECLWVKLSIAARDIYVNRELSIEQPMMIAPIIDNDRIVGLVAIYQLQFEKLTMYMQNLFKVSVGLISSSLSRAYRFEEATMLDRYYNGTMILNFERFKDLVNDKKQGKDKLKINFSLVKVFKNDLDYEEISYILANYIRDVDYMGLAKDGNVYLLLSNTNDTEAKMVVSRLQSKGISVDLLDGEEIDG